ncbi:hypothetical protein SmJEL517_g04748 [Synchytrium microbalum]|uniref:Cell cycle control protein n=1 Tax=Synchytrium microbalum TaxID=1806994 RepID=A0A507BX76_9FUNG|nr:uncharacterized protein SmJEL517_g04748 [Synchytrium microbalum]TPX32032.1 hypothetical protein SmJEL517_g04748 [Synchytrium microbalum]
MASEEQQQPKTAPRTKKEPAWHARFRQQDFKAWNPIFSPRLAMPTLLIAGIILLPIGIGLLLSSSSITETKFDYTQCALQATATLAAPPAGIDSSIVQWKYADNVCTIRFNVTAPLSPPTSSSGSIGASPVFFYIRISGMYQNHHKMVTSFDLSQLGGSYISTASSLSANCDSLRYAECSKSDYAANGPNGTYDKNCNMGTITVGAGAQYYPCGLLANSYFTDVISDPICITDLSGNPCTFSQYTFSTSGLAWPQDKAVYGKSAWLTTNASSIATQLIPPPQWQRSIPAYANGYNATNLPDLSQNERFIGWMMPAGMPTFKKLWGRNDTVQLKTGIYEVNITTYFDVVRFSGTKSIVYSTANVLGGKNPFIGIGYMSAGGVAVGLAFLFVFLYFISPR